MVLLQYYVHPDINVFHVSIKNNAMDNAVENIKNASDFK